MFHGHPPLPPQVAACFTSSNSPPAQATATHMQDHKNPYTCPSGLPPTTEFTTNITHRSSHISMHLIFAQIWKPPTEFNLLSSLKCPTNTFSSTVEVAYPPTRTTKHSAHSREKAKCKRRRTEEVNILGDEQ